ncbi:MucBP domain-containing protein [Candidatus Saccharibacteria bacterium]|nr:MucBP domain-containing protein [Candidatus Saccharibacteria bacterium]
MKSIHKKPKIKSKYAVLFVAVCICIATAIYTTFIRPQFSHAESQYMSAIINGEDGEVDFSPGINDAIVNFSYIKTGSHIAASKIYDAKITLNNLPITDGQKKMSISLPVGMSWVDDAANDQNLLSQLNTSKGTNGIETIALDQEPVLGYTFAESGTRVYYFTEGSKAITINIKVKADNVINLGYIKDAIVVKTYIDNELEEASVDVNVPTGVSIGGQFATSTPTNYVGAGSTFSVNKDYIRTSRSNYVLSSHYNVTRLITKIKFTFHIEGNAIIQSTATDSEQYSFDSSDAANGNYILTYTPNTAITGNLAIPYSVTFSENAMPDEVITITATGETSYWQPGSPDITIAHRNTQTAKYIILPNAEDVTVGWNNLDPANIGTANNINVNSPVREGEGMTGVLGYGYVNNRGNADSSPKKAHITFDTAVLGVMMLRLPCTPRGRIESVHIKTQSGIEKDATVNASCNEYGMSAAISYTNLDIEKDDYITEVEYLIGVIPATTQLRYTNQNDGSRALVFIGKRLNESQPGIATIEVFDANNREQTTGVATIASNVTSGSGGMNITAPATISKIAGETLSFSFTVTPYGATNGPGHIYGTRNPIIYLRSEAKDASGNFLPISNITVTNGTARGNQDITSLFGQITTIDTETAKLYILDGRNVANGLASLSTNTITGDGKLSYSQLIISFSIETSVTTPNQSNNISNMLFIQDPDDGSITSNDASGDPFGISIVENGGMIRKATTNYYQIRQSASVLTENSGKHTSSDTWLTWTEGSNPITIGSVSGSAADMKISLINNSGVEITNPVTVYSPIPKKDQDWGSLSYNNLPFEFSATLDGAITNPDDEHFVIAYGKNVTPSDNGNELDSESAKFTVNTTGWTDSDWQEVNCVKITAADIPANQPDRADVYDFIYLLKTTSLDSASDGSINTWRPLFFQQLVNSSNDVFAGWYKGSYVSIQLTNGTVFGEIFVDTNENGKKDSGEQSLKEAGWKIDLYDKTSDRLVRSTETNTNGQYGIIELITNPDSYYMVVTNKHPLGGAGTTYLFTQKGDVSNTGNYNTDNQAEGDRTSTPAHTTARITPVSPSQTSGEARYNIGVVEYVETTTYSGNVTFNDQNNQFGTRPSTITITITASDNTQQTFSVNTSGNGNFTVDLPKYANTGDKLTYTFSSPDLTNYNKTEQLTGNTYSLTYNQKTARLVVHYYKAGTSTQLIPDSITTVYWGQHYEAPQGDVDTDYEIDSIVGQTSGTVSGNITVTYYYKKKIGIVTTHYYIKDTTTPIADDTTEEYEYGETYTTMPLEEIPDEFANYELVSERPANYTGTVRAVNIDVIYYYQKKDPQINSEVSITGPETIDNKLSPVSYSIDYFAHVVDYIGDTNITLTLKIPYPITEDDSELDGGIYDAENNTITWEVESLYNSYIEGDISIEHAIELVFEGARADDILVTTIEATIELDDKDNDAADTIQTLVRTPAVITFQYVDQDDNEIKEPEQAEGYVGDQCEHEIPEIEGYVIVDDGEIDLTFTEEDRAIIYHYEKIAPEVPNTSGSSKAKLNMNETNEFNSFTLLMCMLTSSSVALIILGLIHLSKRTKK